MGNQIGQKLAEDWLGLSDDGPSLGNDLCNDSFQLVQVGCSDFLSESENAGDSVEDTSG